MGGTGSFLGVVDVASSANSRAKESWVRAGASRDEEELARIKLEE